VLTCEFENVAAACLEVAAEQALTRPAANVFAIAQHRLREKTFVRGLGAPVPDFFPLHTASDLAHLPDRPAILKTASSGYDGKGQRRVAGASAMAQAWHELGEVPCIVEALVDFEHEISVVVARDRKGAVTSWAPFLNHHHNHILDTSLWPAPLPPQLLLEGQALAQQIAVGLDLVGVLCVELFVTPTGLLVNELAPRPHNSGHLTIEAAHTSQFEQLVRIAAGLPLGSTAPRCGGAAMANLLGDCWTHGVPDFAAALAIPQVSLHLYGKQEARPGRKMGHLTAVAATVEEAHERVLAARSAMRGGGE
jgi:5-(carboxyamino)imidazole ribonucleotide synthase